MKTSKRSVCCILVIVMLLGVFANGFAYAETSEADFFIMFRTSMRSLLAKNAY